MITENELELISAAVDQELSPAEQLCFRKLLLEQPEAAQHYTELCQLRDRLRALTRHPVPATFQQDLLNRLALNHPVSSHSAWPSRRSLPSFGTRRTFTAAAIAASLFLLIAAAAFWLSFEPWPGVSPSPLDTELASRQERKFTQTPSLTLSNTNQLPVASTPHTTGHLVGAPSASGSPPLADLSPAGTTRQDSPEQAPMPRSPEPSWIGAAVQSPAPPLSLVEVRLPFFAPVADLDRPDVLAELTQQFSQSRAIRLDLFATDPALATDLLVKTARSRGITVDIDSLTVERLKKKLPISTILVCETITASELQQFLAALARTVRGASPAILTVGHCFPASAADFKELRELFGVDLEFEKPAPVTPPGTSLTAKTVTELTDALRKAGERKRPERSALVLTHSPAPLRVAPSASKELLRFLEERRPRKAEVLPFLIVVRPTASSLDR